MQPARPMETLGEDDLAMLQIALAPAAVAACQVVERGWRFLIGPAKRGKHVNRPAGAADERRLDEIVAQDVSAEGFFAAEFGETGGFGESARADDGVMAPVVAIAAVPGSQARRDNGAVDAPSELLHP